jgi:hypothetical protein
VKVVFIGSWSRSGSTLLDLMLGQMDGFFSAGELRLLWQRGAAENQLCGCARPFAECDVWRRVTEQAFGSLDGEALASIRRLQRAVDRPARVPALLLGRGAAARQEYSAALARLYRALREVTGSRWVVDSSKAASHGLLLQAVPEVELHVVHLVRDSRAVAHSWQRRKRMPEVHWKEAYMPVFAPRKSALFWSLENLALELLRLRARSFTALRYEDLVREPRAALARVLERLGERGVSPGFLAGGRLELGENHTVAGNPLRLRRGEIEVKLDAEWRSKMPRAQAAEVTALTWPLLARYGYLGRSGTLFATRTPA